VGSGLAQTLFDAGLRRATVQQFRAAYDNTVAAYRQTVLSAFQQVEDDLASLKTLAHEIEQQETAVKSSERYLVLATVRYTSGVDSYLNVITAQTTLLVNRQTLVNLRIQQMIANVQLVQALGGGWDTSQMPSPKQVLSQTK
jgi:outer membrane protein TolC